MNLVKEYKGVNIYVAPNGLFYCDTIHNTNDFKNKTFSSAKLPSIEKAIDDFQGEIIEDGAEYYDITVFNNTLKPLRVVRRVGCRLFFDDGTDSSHYSRRTLYPKSIDEKQEFKELESLIQQLKENEKKINSLYENNRQIRVKAENILGLTPKVYPS